MTVKFMWNGIKVDGKLHKAHYSNSKLFNHPEGTITIYGKGYSDLPRLEGLTVQNDSDTMTDYFENDRIRVTPDNRYYNDVLEAYQKQEEHHKKRIAKKRGTIVQ